MGAAKTLYVASSTQSAIRTTWPVRLPSAATPASNQLSVVGERAMIRHVSSTLPSGDGTNWSSTGMGSLDSSALLKTVLWLRPIVGLTTLEESLIVVLVVDENAAA